MVLRNDRHPRRHSPPIPGNGGRRRSRRSRIHQASLSPARRRSTRSSPCSGRSGSRWRGPRQRRRRSAALAKPSLSASGSRSVPASPAAEEEPSFREILRLRAAQPPPSAVTIPGLEVATESAPSSSPRRSGVEEEQPPAVAPTTEKEPSQGEKPEVEEGSGERRSAEKADEEEEEQEASVESREHGTEEELNLDVAEHQAQTAGARQSGKKKKLALYKRDAELAEPPEDIAAEEVAAAQEEVDDAGADPHEEPGSAQKDKKHGRSERRLVHHVKRLIKGIYQEYNPEKLSEVSECIKEYVGSEVELYQKVCAKYGVEPEDVTESFNSRRGQKGKRHRRSEGKESHSKKRHMVEAADDGEVERSPTVLAGSESPLIEEVEEQLVAPVLEEVTAAAKHDPLGDESKKLHRNHSRKRRRRRHRRRTRDAAEKEEASKNGVNNTEAVDEVEAAAAETVEAESIPEVATDIADDEPAPEDLAPVAAAFSQAGGDEDAEVRSHAATELGEDEDGELTLDVRDTGLQDPPDATMEEQPRAQPESTRSCGGRKRRKRKGSARRERKRRRRTRGTEDKPGSAKAEAGKAETPPDPDLDQACKDAVEEPLHAEQTEVVAPGASRGRSKGGDSQCAEFVGNWMAKDDPGKTLATVEGNRVLWTGGKVSKMVASHGTKFSIELGGKRYNCCLRGQELVWDDGDVWIRMPAEELPLSAAPDPAEEEREKDRGKEGEEAEQEATDEEEKRPQVQEGSGEDCRAGDSDTDGSGGTPEARGPRTTSPQSKEEQGKTQMPRMGVGRKAKARSGSAAGEKGNAEAMSLADVVLDGIDDKVVAVRGDSEGDAVQRERSPESGEERNKAEDRSSSPARSKPKKDTSQPSKHGPEEDGPADDPGEGEEEIKSDGDVAVSDGGSSQGSVQHPRAATRSQIARLISDVYRRRNPAKLKEVKGLLRKYAGSELALYDRVCEKYGERAVDLRGQLSGRQCPARRADGGGRVASPAVRRETLRRDARHRRRGTSGGQAPPHAPVRQQGKRRSREVGRRGEQRRCERQGRGYADRYASRHGRHHRQRSHTALSESYSVSYDESSGSESSDGEPLPVDPKQVKRVALDVASKPAAKARKARVEDAAVKKAVSGLPATLPEPGTGPDALPASTTPATGSSGTKGFARKSAGAPPAKAAAPAPGPKQPPVVPSPRLRPPPARVSALVAEAPVAEPSQPESEAPSGTKFGDAAAPDVMEAADGALVPAQAAAEGAEGAAQALKAGVVQPAKAASVVEAPEPSVGPLTAAALGDPAAQPTKADTRGTTKSTRRAPVGAADTEGGWPFLGEEFSENSSSTGDSSEGEVGKATSIPVVAKYGAAIAASRPEPEDNSDTESSSSSSTPPPPSRANNDEIGAAPSAQRAAAAAAAAAMRRAPASTQPPARNVSEESESEGSEESETSPSLGLRAAEPQRRPEGFRTKDGRLNEKT